MEFLKLFGAFGYAITALQFFALALLLFSGGRGGNLRGGLLIGAAFVNAVWAGTVAVQVAWQAVSTQWLWGLDTLRALSWILFLLRLLESQFERRSSVERRLRVLRMLVLMVAALMLMPVQELAVDFPWLQALNWAATRPVFQLLFPIAGLVLVEQLYRNTPLEYRPGIKYLCLGLVALFAYDFFLFSDALLFQRIDVDIWLARGAANAFVVPLIAVSAIRNPKWSFDLSFSRKIVFYTASLIAAGLYLIAMGFVGYQISRHGGDWGSAIRVVFLFGAALILTVALSSRSFRARVKVFLNKHFLSYKYDYREEWLHLISVLSGQVLQVSLPERIIFALSELVDSPGGAIWLCSQEGGCEYARCWNFSEKRLNTEETFAEFFAFLSSRHWIVNLDEYQTDPKAYGAEAVPDWLVESEHLWLAVPLTHEDTLLGIVLLARPRVAHQLDWESLDMIKTVSRQAASYLALEQAAGALADARQFEGFNRLSAFVVHDLKNLIAQLSLVVKNAERHKHNPAFLEDAITTVSNSVDRMSRLLVQLKSAVPGDRSDRVVLEDVVNQAVSEHASGSPRPRLETAAGGRSVLYADRDRFVAVLGHIIQNAQDAASKDGQVSVRLVPSDREIRIDVEDDGIGMDAAFVRDRLFKPFDSTKGLAGMGIGAYECREFIRSLGGRVEVSSVLGRGTRFSMTLPLYGPPINGEARTEPRE